MISFDRRKNSCLAAKSLLLFALIVAVPFLKAAANDSDAPVAVVGLGKTLFFDNQFSADGQHSCASCHKPDRAFSDGLKSSVGVNGHGGTRNSPSLLDLPAYGAFFWDGRAATLEQQVASPVLNPVELGLPSRESVQQIILKDPHYVRQFQSAFGGDASSATTFVHFSVAVAAFERSLVPGKSQFDRYAGGDLSAMNAAAVRGLKLFKGRANCAACHRIDHEPYRFTDNAFHPAGGAPLAISAALSDLAIKLSKMTLAERDNLIPRDSDVAALGRFTITLNPSDIGSFRTPSLRNVAVTAPYMHDGSIATLEEAVQWELYARGGQAGHLIDLAPDERKDLIVYLTSLTDSTFQPTLRADPK